MLKTVQLIRRQDFLLLFLEKISQEHISISFHSDEIRLHNVDTNPWVHLLFYSLKLTCRCLVIHPQNEVRVVHKWLKDRNHFVGEKSFVSTQLLLAKVQKYITSTVPACALSLQLCLTLCMAVDCMSPTRLFCPWDSPGKNAGAGCHFLLQGIFPTQGLNPHLLCLLYWQVGS